MKRNYTDSDGTYEAPTCRCALLQPTDILADSGHAGLTDYDYEDLF